MDIILLKDMDKLGDKHSVVSVKPGYGRNYLIPQGVGVVANAVNRKKLDTLIAEEEAKESARLEEYRSLAQQMEGKTLKIGVKAGTTGKIFGSVTSVQVSQALKDQLGLDVERKKIVLPEEVKDLGTYQATINLHKEVSTKIEFELIAE
ncbi:MAG: 50S ribosomal protein L9 [Saprospiraceae bacterium]|jgi:large subunit ribosomal protein L9|nr:50S ribosomal protein L9 [Saprospiraceae bacterium]MBK7223234.1 50S ribosomal protein L9 [Saprospiraceae bacterium]MBK7790580.1 50S ribosomal protein L9 [Saprospiraceae bacterium]MBK8111531.1 50S ribosomal protein L9 [Saprospiraceae bacterium]MBK8848698.1 50S ribosomal protein L9 [Saprospiraceae bacterium]